jgi:hypothetical protein
VSGAPAEPRPAALSRSAKALVLFGAIGVGHGTEGVEDRHRLLERCARLLAGLAGGAHAAVLLER